MSGGIRTTVVSSGVRARAAFTSLALFTLAGSVGAQSTAPRDVDVVHYDFTLDLPGSGTLVRGRAVIDANVRPGTSALALDLVGMATDSVLVNGQPARYEARGGRITTALPISKDAAYAVTVVYHGRPSDGLIIGTDSAGRWTGFGDNWPNRARQWLPTVDDPADKATVTWHVRAPAARTVVANGTLVARRAVPGRDGWTETEWNETRPVPTYVMVIAAAPLFEYDLGETACGAGSLARCVPQQVYVAPEQRNVLPGAFAEAGPIVQYFASLVGPFDYEKLAHLQSSTRYGGMENASAIFYADAIVRSGRMSPGLIAHETAHQWFGDAVTEATWPHVWLSEGFATYFAALWTQRSRGDSAFRAEMARIRSQVLADSGAVAHRPVIDSTQTDLMALLNTNSYQKGGFVLHMLRARLGDSAFFGGLRRYYAGHENGNATTDDLQHELEASSGQGLQWFFDQWLRRPGFPEGRVGWRYDAARGRVMLSVHQDSRFGTYRFPLTVGVIDAAGVSRQVTVDVPASAESSFELPVTLGSAPAGVVLDPDVNLLARLTVVAE